MRRLKRAILITAVLVAFIPAFILLEQPLFESSTVQLTTDKTAVTRAIKEYIAKNYGDGNCITKDTGDKLGVACMLDTLATPLPEGYTKADICCEEVVTWAYDNVGWCIGAPPTPTPPITPTPTPSSSVKIYAFDQNPAGYDSGKEWVTLYNPSKNPVDIGNWKIKSTHGRIVTVEISEDTILEPGENWTYIHDSQWLDNSEEFIKLIGGNDTLIDQTPVKSDQENDNRYWYNEGGWKFGLKRIKSGIKRGEVINVVDGDTINF